MEQCAPWLCCHRQGAGWCCQECLAWAWPGLRSLAGDIPSCVLPPQDEDEEVYKRDFSAPTLEDHFNKTILPKVMQVRDGGVRWAAHCAYDPAKPVLWDGGALAPLLQGKVCARAATLTLSPLGQELWALRADKVHALSGPGHDLLRLSLGPGECPEHQVLQTEGSWCAGCLREAIRQETEDHLRERPGEQRTAGAGVEVCLLWPPAPAWSVCRGGKHFCYRLFLHQHRALQRAAQTSHLAPLWSS